MSRGLTTWNDETIKLIRENFIAASVPTWVCRAKSPEGEFLRSAGVDKQWVTSSGYMTCLTATGKPLGQKPDAALLKKFQQLPESDRKPAEPIPDLKPDEATIPAPPDGGLVLKVHARFLAGEEGKLRPAETTDFPLMRDKPDVQKAWALFLQPNTEYLWLTREEWQSLIPPVPSAGQKATVRAAIAERLARFHFTPQRATTSEGGIIHPKSVKTAALESLVEEVTPQLLRIRLSGFIHWGSDFDAAQATTPNGPLAQGFETRVHGRLEYDRMKRAITRLDLVAPGQIWGRWGDANGKSLYVERPGRTPFGFACELATGDSPSNRIPPGGNGNYVAEAWGYFTVDINSKSRSKERGGLRP